MIKVIEDDNFIYFFNTNEEMIVRYNKTYKSIVFYDQLLSLDNLSFIVDKLKELCYNDKERSENMDKRYVRIKTWEEMEKEFGVDDSGDINCEPYFTRAMRPLCNKIIKVYNEDGSMHTINDGFEWHISDDMIKEYCE